MGSFYVNFAVAGSDPNAVMEFLESNRRNAFVFSRPDSTTLFFDAEADRQDVEAILGLAAKASAALRCPVLASMNHDDDILFLWLARGGNIVASYNSNPGYFDGGNETPVCDNVELIAEAFGVANAVEDLLRVLRTSNRDDAFIFALHRHLAVAKLLRLPWPHACHGYNYIADSNLVAGAQQSDFTRVGS
jgi:hypothetical protein